MIEQLEIKNFKGVENVKLDKFGIVNSIYGKNNSGKSTILDCIMWLLCDCTLTYGETNNNDVYLNLNKPNELIEASLVVNGNKIERVYGHRLNEDNTITDINYYLINDRRCRSKTDYFDFVDIYLGVKFKSREKINLKYALMNPFVFGKSIKQETFRNLIKEIINVDFDKIVQESDSKYNDIVEDLTKQGKDINNLMTYYKQQIKKEKQFISDYSLKIDNDLEDNTNELSKRKNELLEEKIKLQTNSPYKFSDKLSLMSDNYLKMQKELEKSKQNDILKSTKKVDESLINEVKELKLKVNEKIDEYNSINRYIYDIEDKINKYKNILLTIDKQIELLNQFKVNEIICPNCGEKIIDENQKNILKENTEKIEDFTKQKDKSLSEIEVLEKSLKDNKDKLNAIKDSIISQKKTIEEKENLIKEEENKQTEIVKSEETTKLEIELEKLNNDIFKLKAEEEKSYYDDFQLRTNKINEIVIELSSIQDKENKIMANENLKEVKSSHIKEMALYEAKLTIAKDYAKDLAKTIKNNCYKIFGDDVDFVMVKQNKTNDEQKPVCYAQVNNIPYQSLNSASELLTGIIVIEKIKKFLGLNDIPIIFDVIDNIGNEVLNKIVEKSTSQIFYSEVDRSDKSERTLKIVK